MKQALRPKQQAWLDLIQYGKTVTFLKQGLTFEQWDVYLKNPALALKDEIEAVTNAINSGSSEWTNAVDRLSAWLWLLCDDELEVEIRTSRSIKDTMDKICAKYDIEIES